MNLTSNINNSLFTFLLIFFAISAISGQEVKVGNFDTSLNVKGKAGDIFLFKVQDSGSTEQFSILLDGTAYIQKRLGVGTIDPQSDLHIRNIEKPTILLESDGTNEESGRVSMRQSNGSGADILYDGHSSSEAFAIETFTSGTSQGKKLTVDLDGNVGIGVDNSTERLHILDGDKPTILIESDGNDEESGRVSMRQSNGSGADILYDGTNSEDAFAIETFAGGTSKGKKMIIDLDGHVGINHLYGYVGLNVRSIAGDQYALNVEDDSGTNRLSVRPDGHVGINKVFSNIGLNVRAIAGDIHALQLENSSGGDIFEVNPTGDAWLAGNLTQNSDRRLKKNIEPIDNALEGVLKLGGYKYNWRSESRSQDKMIGVIAQEVQAVFPELVSEDDEGILSVNYSGLSAILIQVVNEQEKEIARLNTNLSGQEKKVSDLQTQVSSIIETLASMQKETIDLNE